MPLVDFPYFSLLFLPFHNFPYLSLHFLTFPYLSLPLPFVTFCYLLLPFVTFPYLSYSTFVLQAVRQTRLEQGCDQSHLLSELGNTAEAATTRSGLMEWGSD